MLAAAELRAPPPDRHEGDVQLWHEPVHSGEQVGVAGEEDPSRAEDRVPERRPVAEQRPPTVVLGVCRPDGERPDRHLVAFVHFDDLESTKPRAEAPRHDDLRPEHSKRRQVEVVVVPVRDQDSVDLVDRLERNGAPQVRDPFPKQWIGHQPNSVELEEHSRVPDVAKYQ